MDASIKNIILKNDIKNKIILVSWDPGKLLCHEKKAPDRAKIMYIKNNKLTASRKMLNTF